MKLIIVLFVCFVGICQTLTAPPQPDLIGELNDLDFYKLIGGPLQAVVNAHAMAARASAKFISEVGFEDPEDSNNPTRTLRMTQWNTSRTDANGTVQTSSIQVPFLGIIPVPFIEVESASVEFNVKLNSVSTVKASNDFSSTATVSGSGFFTHFSATTSFQKSSAASQQEKQDFSMSVKVTAKSMPMPFGLVRVLDWMEKIIDED